MPSSEPVIPILDLSWAEDSDQKPRLLKQLRSALFDVGFLYVKNHSVAQSTIDNLTGLLPTLFNLPEEERAALSKINSPHFVGYNGYAEETTLGKQDLREQFDFATELPVVWQEHLEKKVNGDATADRNGDLNDDGAGADWEEDLGRRADGSAAMHFVEGSDGDGDGRDFTKLYWRLRGPNQWPSEASIPGFCKAFTDYHDAVQELSYRFVHLIEEAFGIPVGTFDHFFARDGPNPVTNGSKKGAFLPPQHRIKLLKYPPSESNTESQGVGAHKDSSGWLTFLYQVSNEPGLEVLSADDDWVKATPMDGTFVVNFGNPFEAATEGAVKATTHRVIAPGPESNIRYSIPFFQGVPLDMTVSEIRSYIPEHVRRLRKEADGGTQVSSFLDPRWDSLGESQLRKWVRSHKDVAEKWYGRDVVEYYTSQT